PEGDGANYNLEMARFPQAWNLMEAIAPKNSNVTTAILEADGFSLPHQDLAIGGYDPLCKQGLLTQSCTGDIPDSPGDQVAGIVGATYDNASPSGSRSRGVSGTNPFAEMRAMSIHGGNHPDLPTVWNLLLDRTSSDLPSLRVVNASFGPGVDIQAWWSS